MLVVGQVEHAGAEAERLGRCRHREPLDREVGVRADAGSKIEAQRGYEPLVATAAPRGERALPVVLTVEPRTPGELDLDLAAGVGGLDELDLVERHEARVIGRLEAQLDDVTRLRQSGRGKPARHGEPAVRQPLAARGHLREHLRLAGVIEVEQCQA